jgi:hypothetical protein
MLVQISLRTFPRLQYSVRAGQLPIVIMVKSGGEQCLSQEARKSGASHLSIS